MSIREPLPILVACKSLAEKLSDSPPIEFDLTKEELGLLYRFYCLLKELAQKEFDTLAAEAGLNDEEIATLDTAVDTLTTRFTERRDLRNGSRLQPVEFLQAIQEGFEGHWMALSE